ncbi:gluconate transporter [Candidatus Izimaplasma bacterium ZiA1]|uniref:GntP family permease n=1 Tax=Candidatus Izimoplasma sp. ZiA1 TaxID=2024899 RepID=UPI000BAA94AB|nr:gluconate transporter [Candidatus Izimaplasma bacterium ZiA1]
MEALYLTLLLVVSIILIVLATSKYKVHPFIVLILAAFFVAIGVAIPQSFGWLQYEGKIIDWVGIEGIIRGGFGGILAYIGIVIVLGTVIGVILEKSGAAVKMADAILRVVGPKRPGLAMSIIGWIVSIPVFCDSGYVILSSLRKSVTRKTKASAVMMSVALATGLYASHTLVPPTPGPIAAAGNLGLEDKLGYVIGVGIFVSIFTMLAGYAWAKYIGGKIEIQEDIDNKNDFENGLNLDDSEMNEKYGKLPSTFMAFAPILIPIILIAIGTVATFPTHPFGEGFVYTLFATLGKPVNALLIGFFISLGLLPAFNQETLTGWIGEGIKQAGPIILITAAGGAFGAVIKATPVALVLGDVLSSMSLGLLVPFIIAAALKSAQGSSTTALVTTSAIMASLLVPLGLDSTMGAVLTVMSIGAGAMTVSHANDSYFWVVAQFTGMDVKTAYKTQTMATLIQGIVTLVVVLILGFIFL